MMKKITLLLLTLLNFGFVYSAEKSAFLRAKAEAEAKTAKENGVTPPKAKGIKLSAKEKEKIRKQKHKERQRAQRNKKKAQKEKQKEKEQKRAEQQQRKYTLKASKVVRLDPDLPKDTTLSNLYMLNSPMNDYQPYAIDKFMIFTSDRYRRPETKSEEFTEKAYFAKRKGKKKWQKPEQNGYKWNSDNNTSLIGMDDENFYFYRCYWPDNGEIFYSSRIVDKQKHRTDKRNPWNSLKLLKFNGVNSEYDETSVTKIGRDSMLFVSNRTGNYDIYMLFKGSVVIPMDSLNTQYDENDLYFDSQSRTLYFASDRPEGCGGYDIYKSILNPQGHFSSPVHIKDTLVNTSFNERDFHRVCDSIMYFASDRDGGAGNLDLYEITISTKTDEYIEDSTLTEEENQIESQRDELMKMLKEFGLLPFHGEVQVGAYRYIKSLKEFYKRFPCIKNQDLKELEIVVDDTIHVHKYIINKVYTIVDEALDKQYEIEKMHCLPDKEFSDMPFIGVLDKKGNRFAIFWKRDEFVQKNIYYIFKNGKIVWKSRKF